MTTKKTEVNIEEKTNDWKETIAMLQAKTKLNLINDYKTIADSMNADPLSLAQLILNNALHQCPKETPEEIVKNLYDSCLTDSKKFGLKAVWTFESHSGGFPSIICSGAAFYKPIVRTRSGMGVAFSCVMDLNPAPGSGVVK